MTMILDHESGEHWVAEQEYEAKWGFRPRDCVGEDGYDFAMTADGPKMQLTEVGKAQLAAAMAKQGSAWTAVLDQVLARHRDEFGC